MSLRSFYVALGLICCLQQVTIATPPINLRKLYESAESRIKKDEPQLPSIDEDVLELEQLKLKNLENIKATATAATTSTTNTDVDILAPIVQNHPSGTKNPLVLGQPEEEEQMVVQYRPHHPTIYAEVPQRQDENSAASASSAAEKNPAKPFYGAARLTYGQNPHLDTKTSSTTVSSTAAKVSENENSTINSIQSSSTPPFPSPVTTAEAAATTATTTTSTITSTKVLTSETNENDSSEEESISAELEATKNGERRSVVLKSPKVAESVLRHPDGQYSSFDMAQYVFWTGDEAGVAKAVEEFIQEGLMSRENAIKFLRDIRLGIEYLQDSYANRVFPEHLKVGPLHVKEARAPVPTISSTTTTTTPEPEIYPTLSPSVRKAFEGIPTLLRLQELNNDRNKENSLDYDEMAGRTRLADFLYAEYSLEEVIYQLAKVMFSQSLTNGSEQAQRALQRLTAFLESENEHGRISPTLQKKILDVILNALSDVLAENPELLSAARAGLGNSFHKLPKHIIDPMKN